jgi:hypothetical protein
VRFVSCFGVLLCFCRGVFVVRVFLLQRLGFVVVELCSSYGVSEEHCIAGD